ncbi:MAG: iron-containing redox enzyme family protein [Deltaproteobacteria bacterium]|nr:MAG: iron-containing redox enzyme family protein [Deltaproteobacteria bacterium]
MPDRSAAAADLRSRRALAALARLGRCRGRRRCRRRFARTVSRHAMPRPPAHDGVVDHPMDTRYLVNVFELEGGLLDSTLRQHPRLRPLFSRDFAGVDRHALRNAYLRLLRLKIEYVQYTVPALRAAGLALRDGDDEDRRWSERLLDYAAGETETDSGAGHHRWARNDMAALGAARELLDAPPHPSALLYRSYFIEDARRHPYAILGAKGVLERFSIRISDDIVAGLLASGIADAERATSFFGHHGVLDIEHVRDGEGYLQRLEQPRKRFQVLEGAYFTSGIYRSLVDEVMPARSLRG